MSLTYTDVELGYIGTQNQWYSRIQSDTEVELGHIRT